MFIGVDIGGTHIRVARGKKGRLEEKIDFPTREFHTSLQEIKTAVERLRKDSLVERIGIGIAGPLDTKTKKLLKPPHLHGWDNIEIEDIFSKLLQTRVLVEHDAAVAALGEYHYGSGGSKDPMLYYTVSTGIGAGLIANGKIYKGVYNMEPGHQLLGKEGPLCLCGQRGDMETFASGEAIEKKEGKKPVQIEETRTWFEDLDYFALGLANTVLHFSPEIVVIGGGMTKHVDHFFPFVKKSLNRYLKIVPIPEIVPSGLGQESGIIGAVTLAERVVER